MVRRIPAARRITALPSWGPRREPYAGPAEESPAARLRIRVPSTSGLPSGLGCDVVETSAECGMKILGCLPNSGCVLAHGDRWSWIVPSGSDIDVTWPAITRYHVDGAVLVPHYGVRPHPAGGDSVVHWPDQAVPYTHPLLLYFAACCIAGVQPAVTVQ